MTGRFSYPSPYTICAQAEPNRQVIISQVLRKQYTSYKNWLPNGSSPNRKSNKNDQYSVNPQAHITIYKFLLSVCVNKVGNLDSRPVFESLVYVTSITTFFLYNLVVLWRQYKKVRIFEVQTLRLGARRGLDIGWLGLGGLSSISCSL